MKKSKALSQNSRLLGLGQGRHLDHEWLREKYIDEGLSTYAIGRLVGRNPKNIFNKLRDFGIPTRSRAETLQANAWWKLGKNPRTGWHHSESTKRALRDLAIGRPGLCGKSNPMFGKRGAETPNWKGGTTPERQKVYRTKEWKALVKYIFCRDSYTCKRCGNGHNRSNMLHTHHIKPWASNKTLRSDPANLITVCNRCHQWIHSAENTKREFIA
jgi:hypothetical protein